MAFGQRKMSETNEHPHFFLALPISEKSKKKVR